MNREPWLSIYGFGISDDQRKPREQRLREFEDNRAQLLLPHGIDEFLRACEFLSYFPRRRTVNQRASSYGLKNCAEDFHRDRGASNDYVSNGALIAAAMHLGFNIRQDGPNAYLNIGAQKDHPVPPPATPGTHLPPRHPRESANQPRRMTWQNMMIGAINAGINQRLFGLGESENYWQGESAIYVFTLGSIPAVACVRDIGFGELAFHVAAKPTADAKEWIEAGNAGFSAGDAFATGWLERRTGKWLQTSSDALCCRRKLLPIIAQLDNQPNGYLPQGKIMW